MDLNEYRKRQKRNKFNAKSTYYNGRYYHSKLEASYAMELDWLKKSGQIKDWIPQYKLPLSVHTNHITNYYADFKVILNSGNEEIHETKGKETDLWRIKWRLAKAIYTHYKFVLIK